LQRQLRIVGGVLTTGVMVPVVNALQRIRTSSLGFWNSGVARLIRWRARHVHAARRILPAAHRC